MNDDMNDLNDLHSDLGTEWECPYEKANESTMIPFLIVMFTLFLCFGLIGIITGVLP